MVLKLILYEKKGTLYFIEAKAGGNIDKSKLNFNKVIPLFSKRARTETILAQNIEEKEVIRFENFSCYNPLFSMIDNI